MTEKQFRMEQFKELARQNKELEKQRKAMTKKHEEYLKRDIIEIYSAMAVVLYQDGNDIEKIKTLINNIGHEWSYHVEHRDERNYMTMAEYCKELTGIDLRENVE